MVVPLPYRDFYYPLNVFMHVLTLEEGEVRYLHYGLFEREGESIGAAQERSTDLLLGQLPPPPARVLDVGAGLGTTLARLTSLGYDAEGITPDDGQIAMLHARHGSRLRVHRGRFEEFTPERPYDVVIFQESSQYIDANALFERAKHLTSRVIVLDEFAVRAVDVPGALHRIDEFLAAAQRHGFHRTLDHDVSLQAAPTIDYFIERLPRFRQILAADLGLSGQQVDDLIESGERYRELYRTGAYGYHLLCFGREPRINSS